MDKEKIEGKTLNIVNENIEGLKQLFPEVFVENKIDFEKLQNLLGNYIDTGVEKYQMTWKGKMDAIRLVQKQSTGTLRPCIEESKNWHKTENLYIEGDNLEVLKLLQSSYLNKIKMIYIDPPYNTGNDFVYEDDFADNILNYKKITEQATKSNPETAGRYHTNWLNMMYPRLKLARNLLTDDGVIFISIDDNEQANLKKICDEIFGEDNFVNLISVKTKNIAGASGGGEDKRLKKNIEYLLVYAKKYNEMFLFDKVYNKTEISELLNYYEKENISWKYTSIIVDDGQPNYLGSTVDGEGNEIKIYRRENTIFKSISQVCKEDNISVKEAYIKYYDKIFTTAMPQSSIRTRVFDFVNEKEKLTSDSVYSIQYVPKTGKNRGNLYEQFYKGEKLRLFAWLKDVAVKENNLVYKLDMLGTLWDGINLNNLTKEGSVLFANGKKPLDLMSKIISMIPDKNFTCLDFFSGSATTAHAIMQVNAKDGGKRKFIMVQLPQIIDKDSEEYDKEFENICEIGKERIRRAGDELLTKIASGHGRSDGTGYGMGIDNFEEYERLTGETVLDNGFKIFKLDSSNILAWDNTPTTDESEIEKRIQNSMFYLKENRKDIDVVYEIMLKNGLSLTLPVAKHTIKDVECYVVDNPAYKVLICLQPNITLESVEAMLKELDVIGTFIFADKCFSDANALINTREILKREERKMRLF